MTTVLATTSCASNITETISAATLAPAARPGAGAFDRQNQMAAVQDQWQQFSSDSDEKLLNIQDVADIRAAPTAILGALIPRDQWTLDK